MLKMEKVRWKRCSKYGLLIDLNFSRYDELIDLFTYQWSSKAKDEDCWIRESGDEREGRTRQGVLTRYLNVVEDRLKMAWWCTAHVYLAIRATATATDQTCQLSSHKRNDAIT
jgi:hypothetical protein